MHPSPGNYPVLNWLYNCLRTDTSWLADASSLKLDGIVRGLMDDNCVWEFLNCTTKLFNEPWNCSNHALVVILTKYLLQWVSLDEWLSTALHEQSILKLTSAYLLQLPVWMNPHKQLECVWLHIVHQFLTFCIYISPVVEMKGLCMCILDGNVMTLLCLWTVWVLLYCLPLLLTT